MGARCREGWGVDEGAGLRRRKKIKFVPKMLSLGAF